MHRLHIKLKECTVIAIYFLERAARALLCENSLKLGAFRQVETRPQTELVETS
jgi:hypothetical protein